MGGGLVVGFVGGMRQWHAACERLVLTGSVPHEDIPHIVRSSDVALAPYVGQLAEVVATSTRTCYAHPVTWKR